MVPEYEMKFYRRLQARIVESAVNDYRRALYYAHKAGFQNEAMNRKAKNLEEWFLTGWAEFLTDGNGLEIIKRVKKEVEEGTYNPRTTKNRKITTEQETEAIKLRYSGYQISEIARKLGLNVETVRSFLFQYDHGYR